MGKDDSGKLEIYKCSYLNSFEEIREYIINLAEKNNIYLEPNNI